MMHDNHYTFDIERATKGWKYIGELDDSGKLTDDSIPRWVCNVVRQWDMIEADCFYYLNGKYFKYKLICPSSGRGLWEVYRKLRRR